MSKSQKTKMSLIMKKAWKLFKDGLISFSVSLRVSWQIAKGKVKESEIMKMLKGGSRR